MTRYSVVRSLSMGLAAGVLSACFGERTSVLDPVSPPSYNLRFAVANLGIPRGTVALSVFTVPAADSAVVVTLQGLKALSGAFYKVWLMDSLGATFTPAAGRVIVTQVDTVQGSLGDSAVTTTDTTTLGTQIAVRGGDGGTAYTIRILKSQQGSNPRAGAFHQVLVSIETDSLATTPGTARALWRRYRAPGATGAVSFGNFNSDAALVYGFVAAGSGLAGFRVDEVQADLGQLSRPPIGYYYRAWLVVTTGTQVTSTTGVGGLTAPYPRNSVSLDESDVSQVDETVLPQAIRTARVRALAGDLGLQPDSTGYHWFKVFTQFAITLEPKAGGASMGPSVVLQGALPDIVRNPRPGQQ